MVGAGEILCGGLAPVGYERGRLKRQVLGWTSLKQRTRKKRWGLKAGTKGIPDVESEKSASKKELAGVSTFRGRGSAKNMNHDQKDRKSRKSVHEESGAHK